MDLEAFRLTREGREIPLERRSFDLLRYLIEHRQRVVTKDELVEQVWEARALSDGALSNTVAKLRRALGQSAREQEPIETCYGRGYRFIGDVRAIEPPPAPAAPEPEQPAPGLGDDPFVGRQALLQALHGRVFRARGGSENIIVLAGEAGIGKTRTARELAQRTRRAGARVWFGAAYEGTATPPYWPWAQILRHAWDDLSEPVFRGQLSAHGGALAQLVPELLGEGGQELGAEPQSARFRLFQEVSQFLRRAASQSPLLVVLDDLHCADLGTIELLRFAARALQESPIVFLVTLRLGGGSDPLDHEGVLAQLGRAANVTRLQGLSEEEVSTLALKVAGEQRIDLRTSHKLHARTQGNPLFVRQALELIVQCNDRSFVDDASGGGVPPAIQQVVKEHLSHLPQATRAALVVAAVIGKRFDAALLAELLEQPLEQVLDALDFALRRGVLEVPADAPQELEFAHVLARDCFYEELGLRERGALHGKVARILARRGGTSARQLGALAHHHLHAQPFDAQAAVSACRRAATLAQENSGFEAAAELLNQVIAKLETEGSDAETRCRLRLELGEDHFYAGAITSAWQAFRDAADTARLGGRADLLAEAAPRLVDCLELGVGELGLARSVVEHALDSPANRAPAVRAMLLAQRAELSLELPIEARFRLLDEAAALACESGELSAVLEAAHSRAILRDPTRLDESERAVEAFFELTERHAEAARGMRYRSLRRFGAYMTRYLCALTACDLSAADLALTQCQHVAETSHVRAARFATDLMRAGRALGDGRLDELQAMIPEFWLRTAVELPTESHAWAGYYARLLGARGNIALLSKLNLDAVGGKPEPASKHDAYFAIGRAHVYARVGQLDAARALLTQVPASDLARMPVQYGDLGALCDLVEIHGALGDHGAARALYPKLEPFAHLNAVGPSFEYRGAVAYYQGLLARSLGHKSDAQRYFAQAREINQALGMPASAKDAERELLRS